MLSQLKLLVNILRDIDSNPSQSMMFYTGGSYKQHLSNPNSNPPPTPDCRWILIVEALQHIDTSNPDATRDISHKEDHHEVLRKLNTGWQETQHLCWHSHDHHFHINFHQYVLCPVTCLYEIIEYIEKVIKEKYIV
jgi:hypothetical protein